MDGFQLCTKVNLSRSAAHQFLVAPRISHTIQHVTEAHNLSFVRRAAGLKFRLDSLRYVYVVCFESRRRKKRIKNFTLKGET